MENNVPVPSHVHVIIIGSGGSGMSLLWALIKEQVCRKQTVLVIEPETKDKNDRTWCFWAHKSDDIVQDYQSIIQHSWLTFQSSFSSMVSSLHKIKRCLYYTQ